MKIKDIIAEGYHGYVGHHLKDYGTVRKGEVDEAIPGAVIEPEIRNTDTYMQMRYGMALAAAAAAEGGDEFNQESAWAENIGMVTYTPQEMDRIKAADKLMGVKSVALNKPGSQERTDINSKSPVADTSWRKN